MHKDWHWHEGPMHGHHGWHRYGQHPWGHGWGHHHWNRGWMFPALGFLFFFVVFKGWFLLPLLIGLFFVLPALRRWQSDGPHTEPGWGEKRKPHPRFVDVDEAGDSDDDRLPKRKNDDRRYVRTADGDYLEIV